MTRFTLSPSADDDLDEIIAFVQSLPERPGSKLGKILQDTLYDLAKHPNHGHVHEAYSHLAREEIRRFVSKGYVFFYSPQRKVVLFVGILHGKRDIDTIVRSRWV